MVDSWIAASGLDVSSTQYVDGVYRIVLTGSTEPPAIDELAADMETEFGQPIPLEVIWVPSATFTFDP